ncbi:MAG TPA: VWA domain-containing protein [Pyrinomonadaceae bacterium]|jgi:VWFA-related protein
MNRRQLLISSALILCLNSGAVIGQQPTAQDDEVIRVESDLTNLLFIATDKQNHFITSLRQEDVRVLEDGVPQQLFTFQRETARPLSIAFLIDVSGSEERTLSQEKGAARTFIETIIRSKQDQAAIIPFTDRAFLEQALTNNVLGIYQALERVDVAMPSYLGSGPPISGIASRPGMSVPREGSTAIWDAVLLSTREVLVRAAGKRRRAIILLTDGFDTSSRVARNAAINQAIDSETVIYAIGIGDSKQDGVNKGVLNTVTDGTGGRAFFPKNEADLKAAFVQIEQELRSQYLIAYSSSNKKRDGTYRQMQIEITNPALLKDQLKLRYRPGYFAKPVS